MGTPASTTTPRTSVCAVLDDVLAGLETVRVTNRTDASDADRLSWVEKLVEAERRVSALKTVLIGEADEAGAAMRAVHTPPAGLPLPVGTGLPAPSDRRCLAGSGAGAASTRA